MKNILYLGNALSQQGKTATSVETLGSFLNEIVNVKIGSSKSNKILRLLDMISLIVSSRKNTDFVLIDTYSTLNFYYALITSQLCRVLKLRFIPILRGGELEKRLMSNPRFSKLIFENAYLCIAPSGFMKSIFEKHNYLNIIVIPNTIELSNYEFSNRSHSKIKILWVRSFSKLYKPDNAVLVLKYIKDNGYKADLTMVGPEVDGSLEETHNLALKNNLKVNFTGRLSKKEWINLAKDHNFFINTTSADNTPVSVIEAMALGLAVVSTDVGGMPFLIENGKTGVLVPVGDIKKMGDAIIRLFGSEHDYLSLVNTARNKVEDFSWKSVMPLWSRILK